MRKLIDFQELDVIRNANSDNVIVQCHGVFDVLHPGHLAYLNEAIELGYAQIPSNKRSTSRVCLVVTVTADQFVNKGPGRPHYPAEVRAKMLASLTCVDYVCISEFPTAQETIRKLRPNFYIKGKDYRNTDSDLTHGIIEEGSVVEAYGGKLLFTDTPLDSSSSLINKYFVNRSDAQQATIALIKDLGGIPLITKLLNDISKLEVTLAGEPINDVYAFCEPKGISSKSPTISVNLKHIENYEGGVLAIHNHLKEFVPKSRLINSFVNESGYPTKVRYIGDDRVQRIFECTDIKDNPEIQDNFISDLVGSAKRSNLTILADFGHGLFEGDRLKACNDIESLLALNVQTNSTNYGFNLFTKHETWDYLSIDTCELRLAFNDKNTDPLDLFKSRLCEHYKRHASLTRGSKGALYYGGTNIYSSPAFACKVVDAIGAGDAYFTITSLLFAVDAPAQIIPFMGNVFAGLKTKIVGNKEAVSKASFMKAITALLR